MARYGKISRGGRVLVLAGLSAVSLWTAPAVSQGLGVPGAPLARPQRGASHSPGIGSPGQMNQRMGGFRPGQRGVISAPSAPSMGASRGAFFAGPRNATSFSGMQAGGGVMQSSQGYVEGARNAGTAVPGVVGGGGR
jgi:hypothetical protein